MVNIISISHGAFCEGPLVGLQMAVDGDYGVRAMPLIPGESPEAYREKLEAVMREVDDGSGSGTIASSDIAGGTPFQSVACLSEDSKLGPVSGMNMPILLTLALERSEETVLGELADKAGTSSTVGVKTTVFKKGEKKQRAKLSVNRNRRPSDSRTGDDCLDQGQKSGSDGNRG